MMDLILLILLSCKACGSNDYTARGIWWDINSISTIRVYVDTVFSEAERTLIITTVIQQWNSHTQDCGFSVQYTDDYLTPDIRIDIKSDITAADIISGFRSIGSFVPICVDKVTGRLRHNDCHPCVIIEVAPPHILDSLNIDLYTVLRHEMGHALGLWHTKNSDCLMYKYYLGERDIGAGESNGLICIYGSLFGDRVKPAAGSDTRIKNLDRRHISIKIVQGACNGDGIRGADSAKIKMNFYHGYRQMTWETIDSFNYASRYYEDSIIVELPPDDSNYSGWRVIKSYIYFPDTVIVNVSDTFDFNALPVREYKYNGEVTTNKNTRITLSRNILRIQNNNNFPITVSIYNTIGQSNLKPVYINAGGEFDTKIHKGLYLVVVKYTDSTGQEKVSIKRIIIPE